MKAGEYRGKSFSTNFWKKKKENISRRAPCDDPLSSLNQSDDVENKATQRAQTDGETHSGTDYCEHCILLERHYITKNIVKLFDSKN